MPRVAERRITAPEQLYTYAMRDQEAVLEGVLKSHPKLEPAGSELLHQHWVIEFQKKVPRFFKQTWP